MTKNNSWLRRFFLSSALMGSVVLSAQIKVNYDAIPDYDFCPPVKWELGVENGNARNSRLPVSARSKGYGVAEADPLSLPDHWNNALFKHFPPFFYQSGPSCMCSSFTGYIFTHELNSYRDLEGAKLENQMAVFFGWLQTYQNSSKEDIERDNGCPNAVDYGGRTNSTEIGYYDWRSPHAGWMQGYQKWYRAMFNRAEGFYSFPLSVKSEAGRLATKRWLYNHNGDLDFKSGGLCYVTLAATGMSAGKIANTPANSEAGAVGKQYITKWGPSVDHAMTLIGWDDRLEFDFDGDGIYGEEEEDEKGAWVVANSWGEYWHNGGWTYVPYRLAGPVGSVQEWWQPYVTYIRKAHTPTRTLKLLMDYSHRNELLMRVGVSADTSAKAPSSYVYMSSFRNAGNGSEEGGYPEVPMLGMYVDGMHYEPMEFGYDLTDLSEGYDPALPLKYFFQITLSNGAGSGHIYKASVMDYCYEREHGVEIPFPIDTVLIDKKNNQILLSVVVPGEAINPPVNVMLKDKTLRWDAPKATSIKLKKFYVYKDNCLVDSVSAATLSYTVPDALATYCVSAVYAGNGVQVESERSNLAYGAKQMPEGDNVALTLKDARFVVPNATNQSLNEATLEFWLKPNQIGGCNYRVTSSQNKKFFFEITPSGQAMAGWDNDDYVTTAAKSVKANTWQHFAIVWQRNQMLLYVNGMKKGTATSSNQMGLPALGDLQFGVDGSAWNAEIDEVRIWRKARAMGEIYASKDMAVKAPSAQLDLIAYLPMNLLQVAGEERMQEFVNQNHGYIVEGESQENVCIDILQGSSFKFTPSITLGDSIYAGLAYQLVSTGSTGIVSWLWSTPGATQQQHTLQSPYVIYQKPGNYSVTLQAQDAQGTVTTATKEIVVTGGSLAEPDFIMSDSRLATTQPLSLVNMTRSGNSSYTWRIDGKEDIHLTNTNVSFDEPGVYNITLVATNPAGSAELTKQVEVYRARPTSNFNVAPADIYLGETTYLEDKSAGNPSSWVWTLSNGKRYVQVNGQFSSLVPPAPGYYDVSLQTSNDVGSNIQTKSRALCVSNADAKNGLVFAGNDEQLELDCPFAANQSSFTIEWWMNPNAYAAAGAFVFGDLSANCSDKGVYSITYKSKTFTVSNFPIINQWHHYCVQFNAGRIYLYRDAVQIASFDGTGVYATPSWPAKFTYGRSDSPFSGYIDEMRIWKSAMTLTQLKEVCNQPVQNSAEMANLCVYYDFNQNGGDVIDRSGNGYDAKRLNFGPDGDAWIVSRGVFTLDFEGSVQEVDVTSKYMTNYKAPFLSNGTRVSSSRKGAKELLTEDDKSTWVFLSPRWVDDNTVSTVFVDSINSNQLAAYTNYGMGNMYNQRLYQTVTLDEGHYRFTLNQGSYFSPQNSRLVVCYGDSIVTNENLDDALAYCLLLKSKTLEFDVPTDGTNISLGIIFNISGNSLSVSANSFKLTRLGTMVQEADGVGDAYQALERGNIGMFTGEVGALRIVTSELTEVKIFNAQGQCVMNEYVSGNKRIALPSGLYVANGVKVLVK